MATHLLPTGGIALRGAPDSDIGSRDAKSTPIQAMQVDMAQDLVDELLESLRSGKPPQIYFGRTPVRACPRACARARRRRLCWWWTSRNGVGRSNPG